MAKIEQFGKRVDLILKAYDCDPRYARRIDSVADLWRALCTIDEMCDERTFRRYRRAPHVDLPEEIVRGLLLVFPSLRRDLLLTPGYVDFEPPVLQMIAALDRWTAAAKLAAREKYRLGLLSKRFYASVDETPDYPSLGRAAWLLDHPQELAHDSPLPRLTLSVAPNWPRPDGLDVDFVQIKKRQQPVERPPTDNESYRVINIAPSSNKLELTFGPLSYFQFVNTGEAIGAELADFVLRKGWETVPAPSALPLRGPPEALYDFAQRPTYASVVCLLLMKNYLDPKNGRRRDVFALHRRGGDTLQTPNMTALVPSGGHQPLMRGYGEDEETSLWRSAVREFCEELFNKEEAAQLRQHGQSFLDAPQVKRHIEDFFLSGASRVFLLGAALDPVSLGCDFLMAIVVDWQKANAKVRFKLEANYEGRIDTIPLSPERLIEEAEHHNADRPLSPSSETGLRLAHKHFQALMA